MLLGRAEVEAAEVEVSGADDECGVCALSLEFAVKGACVAWLEDKEASTVSLGTEVPEREKDESEGVLKDLKLGVLVMAATIGTATAGEDEGTGVGEDEGAVKASTGAAEVVVDSGTGREASDWLARLEK